MGQILLVLNTYVPFQDEVQTVQIDGESICRPETKLSPRLIYGDQLTVARARGAASLRCWHETAIDRLEGYVPVTSDWHARLCLVTVRATDAHDCVMIFYFYVAYSQQNVFWWFTYRQGHTSSAETFGQPFIIWESTKIQHEEHRRLFGNCVKCTHSYSC